MNALKKSVIVAALATILAPSVANAVEFGRLQNVSCNVIIERNGELLQAVEGSMILAGDVLHTGGESSADIIFSAVVGETCSGAISASSSLPVGNSCSALNNASPLQDTVTDLLGGATCGGGYVPTEAVGGGVNLVPLIAGVSALGLVIAAVNDNDDAATSP